MSPESLVTSKVSGMMTKARVARRRSHTARWGRQESWEQGEVVACGMHGGDGNVSLRQKFSNLAAH